MCLDNFSNSFKLIKLTQSPSDEAKKQWLPTQSSVVS